MAGGDEPSTAVGAAAEEHPLPPAPTDPTAIVCRCMGVTVGDLDEAWSKGYTELELLKRATLGRHRHVPGRGVPAPRPRLDRRADRGGARTRSRPAPAPARLTLG